MTESQRVLEPNELMALMPFAVRLGAELSKAEPDEVVGTLAWAADRCTVGGMMHGGAMMAFADSLGGVCAYLNLPPGARTSTIESKTNFLRGVGTGVVTGICKPLHVGRTVIVVQTDLWDKNRKRVAQTTQTQAVIP